MNGQFFFFVQCQYYKVLKEYCWEWERMNLVKHATLKSIEHQENYEKRFSMFFMVCVTFLGVIGTKVY